MITTMSSSSESFSTLLKNILSSLLELLLLLELFVLTSNIFIVFSADAATDIFIVIVKCKIQYG